MPTRNDLLTSNPQQRPQPLDRVTVELPTGPMASPHPATETTGAAERRITAVLRAHAWRTPESGRRTAPLPTLTTLRITGQVRPDQDAPTEHALDHEVTFVPATVPEADDLERACNLLVGDTVIGWVAYGRVSGSYGWVWGSQLASHGSFQFVATSRSAAAFSELLAAVRAGTVADARSAAAA